MKIDQLSLICPINDGESKMIVDIAQRHGIDTRISPQPWGATLDKEPAATFRRLKPLVAIVEIPHPAKENWLRRQGHKVIIIDHHKYADGLDRYQKKSSLEQFAELIGHRLNRFERGMAINDRAWIYGLLAAGYRPDEIKTIREYDLAAQGLAEKEKPFLEQIAEAADEIAPGMFACQIPHNVNLSYIRDLIALRDTSKVISSLLIIHNGRRLVRLVFTGLPRLAKKLEATFGGTLAGDERYSMVWTTTKGIIEEVKKFVIRETKSIKKTRPRDRSVAEL